MKTIEASLTEMASQLCERYISVRHFSHDLVRPLSPEDCMIQSMPDTSPTRWHLAHTTWFFETFVLGSEPNYQVVDPVFNYLFNSYYNAVGSQFPRPSRGLLSRPGLSEIISYRQAIDQRLVDRLQRQTLTEKQLELLQIGLHHEQQHQELILTDIKHALAANPILPAYQELPFAKPATPVNGGGAWSVDHGPGEGQKFSDFPAGVFEVGFRQCNRFGASFCYDNELPRHEVLVPDYQLAKRTVTCGEYLDFINDGGYQRPDLWLALGWDTVQKHQWDSPLYWCLKDGKWFVFTLAGLVPLENDSPVCHISYLEADAFARWAGCRLPTEFEWELACTDINSQRQPSPKNCDSQVRQLVDHLHEHRLAIHPSPAATGYSSAATGVSSAATGVSSEATGVSSEATGVRSEATGVRSEAMRDMIGGVWEWTSSSYAAYPGYRAPPGAIGEYNGKFMCQQYVLRGGSVATHSTHIRPTYRNFFDPAARWQFSGLRLAKSP